VIAPARVVASASARSYQYPAIETCYQRRDFHPKAAD
jgi:hypothetical protein